MAVLLLEGRVLRDTGHRAAGGVQVLGAERLGHAVPEAGGRLGEAEHERRASVERLADQPTQLQAGPMYDARIGRDVLAEDVGHEQVRAPRVAAQREVDEFRQGSVAGKPDAEPIGDPTVGHC